MPRKPKLRKGEPTQKTETGLEIPIPNRRDFMGNMRKITKTPKKPT